MSRENNEKPKESSHENLSGGAPSWIKKYCNESDLLKISLTVKKAESRTSGEIVPMIVRSSSPRTFIPALIFLLLAFGISASAETLFHSLWIPTNLMNKIPLHLLAAVIAWFLGNSDFLLRWLTPKEELRKFVHRRAQFEFYEASVQRTQSATGVLIFVSLAEKQVVVLGDENISKHISQSEWYSLVDDLVSEVKEGKFAEGICKSVIHAGEILEKFFPRKPVDFNELPNHLIVKD